MKSMKSDVFEKKILDRLINVFKKNDIAYAGVFGSYAKNRENSKSDIDFLIEFKPENNKTLFDMVDIQDELEKILKKNVDLVTKNSLNKYLKDEVLRTTKILYG